MIERVIVFGAIGVACRLFIQGLAGFAKRYQVLIDCPSSRGLHTQATPRVGGIIVGGLFLLITAAGLSRQVDATYVGISMRFLCFLFGVFLLGTVDDYRPLPAWLRLVVQLCLTTWFIAGFHLHGVGVLSPSVIAGMATMFLVGLINFYNFMDGMDGLAAGYGLSVLLCVRLAVGSASKWGGLLNPVDLLLCLLMGFLSLNFPRASVFMGDGGSGFLGAFFGGAMLIAFVYHPPMFWALLVGLGWFVLDPAITLIRRALTGKNLFHAHRDHAYQRLAMRFNRSPFVVLSIVGIPLFWLVPVASWVLQGNISGWTGLIVGYTPVLAAIIWVHMYVKSR